MSPLAKALTSRAKASVVDGFPAGDGAGCVAHRGLKDDVVGGLLEPVFEDVCCVLVRGAGVYQQGA